MHVIQEVGLTPGVQGRKGSSLDTDEWCWGKENTSGRRQERKTESSHLVLLKKHLSVPDTRAESCSSPPQQSSAWHSLGQGHPGRPALGPVLLIASNILSDWGAGQKKPASTCTDQFLPWLQRSMCTHIHTCAHTHFPQFLIEGGTNEVARVGLWAVCSLNPAATYVPVCCSPGPCFLCSCKMETFERGGNSFYVSFWSTVKEHEDGGEGQKKKQQWILKHARKTKMETMVS